jgi:DNA-binding transcriptional LysR family regulator
MMSNMQRKLLPSTQALAAFDAVARLRGFSAAAIELSLTQGAISRQVSLLEDLLGVRLFDRTSRGVALTSAGEKYAKSIAAALDIIRSASLEAMTQMAGNTLDLAILPTFGTRWLMPRISGFVSRHPEIIVNFATRIGQFDFEREGLDAAIHVGRPDWPGAECDFLMDETVVPVCSPRFLAENPVREPADLLDLPLFHMASRPGAWNHWFASQGLQAPAGSGMGFEQFSNVAQAAMAGLGVALMPVFLIRSELDSGQLVKAYPAEIRSTSAYYLVSPLAKRNYPPVRAFRDWLLSEVRQAG